ncbi:unnamed protein product [Rotaria magnacalcarata]|uniref:Reverse transcriptase domain-containing protein n=1 Tax=Rotaria magnacalcarata TaxID=392030 RepID=A0A8S2XLS5_9BILA|nr:unnamed protein product [Rotaria magnacalcarata]
MVSFDIATLYTNVPLDETIEIILKILYVDCTKSPIIKRDDLKKLLISVTKKSHFLFDGKVYDQIDGVSMGYPVARLLAEIFLKDFERKNLSTFEDLGIIYYKRYIDDTFVLTNSTLKAGVTCKNPPIPLPPTVNTDTVIIRIPYFGLTSKVYGKRLTLAIKYHYPPKLTRIVDDVKDRIGSAVTIKDNIPTQSKSYVVYEANCPKCSDTYIEKTYRQH